jgi:hypothetical protein
MKQKLDPEILKKEEAFWLRIKKADKKDPGQSCRK